MTEQQNGKLYLNQPKWYYVDVNKLRQTSMGDGAYLFATLRVCENYEHFDKVKEFLIIPEEPKSLEQIKKEFYDRMDDLIGRTKRNFYASNLTAERKYQDFCDRQDDTFDCMKKYRYPHLTCVIDYPKAVSNPKIISTNSVTLEIRPKESVGYYEISSDFHLWLKQKPSGFFRLMSRILLNWRWKDA